jgi:hypothetical protein
LDLGQLEVFYEAEYSRIAQALFVEVLQEENHADLLTFPLDVAVQEKTVAAYMFIAYHGQDRQVDLAKHFLFLFESVGLHGLHHIRLFLGPWLRFLVYDRRGLAVHDCQDSWWGTM